MSKSHSSFFNFVKINKFIYHHWKNFCIKKKPKNGKIFITKTIWVCQNVFVMKKKISHRNSIILYFQSHSFESNTRNKTAPNTRPQYMNTEGTRIKPQTNTRLPSPNTGVGSPSFSNWIGQGANWTISNAQTSIWFDFYFSPKWPKLYPHINVWQCNHDYASNST